MPQRITNTEGLGFNSISLLERPRLAAYIAAISALATNTEATMGSLMVASLGLDAEFGIDLYNAIENDGAKQSVMKTMGKRALSPQQYSDLIGLLKKVRERGPDRNRVIHGMWGTSPHYPDGVIWLDPREFMAYFAKLATARHKDTPPPIPPWQEALVYSEQDFKEVYQRLRTLLNEVDAFWKQVIHQAAPGSEAPQ